jgi:hypothetical protein
MKQIEYGRLVAERKSCRLCPKLQNPAMILGGALDCDELGPCSRWQGSLDAELVVVAPDFADSETYVRLEGWPGARHTRDVPPESSRSRVSVDPRAACSRSRSSSGINLPVQGRGEESRGRARARPAMAEKIPLAPFNPGV